MIPIGGLGAAAPSWFSQPWQLLTPADSLDGLDSPQETAGSSGTYVPGSAAYDAASGQWSWDMDQSATPVTLTDGLLEGCYWRFPLSALNGWVDFASTKYTLLIDLAGAPLVAPNPVLSAVTNPWVRTGDDALVNAGYLNENGVALAVPPPSFGRGSYVQDDAAGSDRYGLVTRLGKITIDLLPVGERVQLGANYPNWNAGDIFGGPPIGGDVGTIQATTVATAGAGSDLQPQESLNTTSIMPGAGPIVVRVGGGFAATGAAVVTVGARFLYKIWNPLAGYP